MTASSAFEIHEAPRQGWVRLLVTGELDVSNALTFRRRLRVLKAADTNVSVDLSQLEFIDCAGAHALLDAIEDSRQGAWHVEVAPSMPAHARRCLDWVAAAGLSRDP